MEGVSEVLADDQRTWKQNEQGKWYAVGYAVPHQLRAGVVIQLKEDINLPIRGPGYDRKSEIGTFGQTEQYAAFLAKMRRFRCVCGLPME